MQHSDLGESTSRLDEESKRSGPVGNLVWLDLFKCTIPVDQFTGLKISVSSGEKIYNERGMLWWYKSDYIHTSYNVSFFLTLRSMTDRSAAFTFTFKTFEELEVVIRNKAIECLEVLRLAGAPIVVLPRIESPADSF